VIDARMVVAAALVLAGACARTDDSIIEGVGTLELIEVDVSPTMPARVDRMYVAEGDRVKPGDTIAVLSVPTLGAELAQGRAAEAFARANLDELVAGARQREIERAEAELAARVADHARRVDDSTRLAPLVAKSLASEAELVAARNAVLGAAAQRDAAAAALTLLREGTRTERISAGRAEVERAGANIAATEAMVRDLVLVASVHGIVVTRSAEPGEVIAAGRSVATIAESQRPWVRVYLGPQFIPLVQIGDTATAVLDAFPDRVFQGRVTSIATRAEYTPRVALTERERADLLYGVRVDFSDSTGMLKAGLPVTVRFPRRVPAQ